MGRTHVEELGNRFSRFAFLAGGDAVFEVVCDGVSGGG